MKDALAKRSVLEAEIQPNLSLDGATCVRFGPYEAMTGGKTLTETNNDPVWKVWFVTDEKNPDLIDRGLKRDEACIKAKQLADVWRAKMRAKDGKK